MTTQTAPDPRCAFLTDRELQILQALTDGCTARCAGRRLGISGRTVEAHLQNIYGKLGVHNRIQALRVVALAGRVWL
jgi:DNA-binding NarL/FixJ family response regulator